MATYVIRDDKGLEEAYTKEEVDTLMKSAGNLDCEATSQTYNYTGA